MAVDIYGNEIKTGVTSTTPVTNALSSTYNPTLGGASNSTATNWNVDAPQTVAGQVTGLIDANSPLMQQAATKAKQSMNSTGLLNSSMAVGAGQNAVIGAALPIAQADASTYANSAQFNADNNTRNSQFNSNQNQNMTTQNMNASNTASQFNASNNTDISKFNASSANNAGQFNADSYNQMEKFNVANQVAATARFEQDQQQKYMQSAEFQQAKAMFGEQAALQKYMQSSEFAQTKDMFVLDEGLKKWLTNTSFDNQKALASIDIASKKELANIEANYKTVMQVSQSATDMYKDIVGKIAAVAMSPNESTPATITQLQNYLKSGLNILGSINAINVGSLLTFDGTTAPAATVPAVV